MSLQQFWDQYVVTPKNRYRRTAVLAGHHGPINCFAISQGDLLASGGDDQRVLIWDLKHDSLSQTLEDRHGRWGQITAMIAMDSPATGGAVLTFGTGRGKILTYKRPRKQNELRELSVVQAFGLGDGVEALCYDPVHNRLGVSSHFAKISLFRLEKDGSLSSLWSQQIGEAIPRAIHFTERGENILIYSLENGIVDTETSTEKYSRALKSPIGNADVCPSSKNVITDNLTSGFDLYAINRTSPTRSFEVSTTRKYIKMVKFGENGAVVVGGSDHGIIYVFDTNTSELLQVLGHGDKSSMIQTIAALTSLEEHIIISGSSNDFNDIYVWRKPTKRALLRNASAAHHILDTMAKTCVVFLFAMLFLTWRDWFPGFVNSVNSVPERVRVAMNNPQRLVADMAPKAQSNHGVKITDIDIDELDEEMLRKILLRVPKSLSDTMIENTAQSLAV